MQAQPKYHPSHECDQNLNKVVDINISTMSMLQYKSPWIWIDSCKSPTKENGESLLSEHIKALAPLIYQTINQLVHWHGNTRGADIFITVISIYIDDSHKCFKKLPVPKLSSPQIEHIPASIKLPKNFHPVGTWNMVFYVTIVWHSKIL